MRGSRLSTVFLILFIGAMNMAYGQIIEFLPSEKLPRAINSESEESMPLVSPSGEQIFFTRTLHRLNTGGENAGQDIWVSHKKQDGTWTRANNNFPEWNNRFNNALVGMSSDGKTVYLLNSYQVEGQTKGLAFSRFVNGKWTKPEKIDIKGLDLTGYIGSYMNSTYDVLIISMEGKDSMGEEDLYVSFLTEKGKWSKPKSLGATINSAGFEISPFLSEDKRTLFFSTNGRIGYGDADIYMSQRLYDSWEVWSTPVNLGPNINSDKFDAYFSLRDSSAYYVSNKEEELSDIYTSKISNEVVDYSQQQVNEIVKEAEAILADLQESGINDPWFDAKSYLVPFDYNSVNLSEKSKKELDKVVKQIIEKQSKEIKISGASNELFDEAQNSELSYSRVEAVFLYLSKIFKKELLIQKDVSNNEKDKQSNRNGVLVYIR